MSLLSLLRCSRSRSLSFQNLRKLSTSTPFGYASGGEGGGAGGGAAAPNFKLEVRHAEGAGRGLFAADPLPASTRLFSAPPLVCHPHLEKRASVCNHCLRALPPPEVAEGEQGLRYCSEECSSTAARTYHLQGSAGEALLSGLEAMCVLTGARFPLIIARLAIVVASGLAKEDVLGPLCHADLGEAAHHRCSREHALLHASLQEAGFTPDQLAFLTLEWYMQQLGRAHVNVFRVEALVPPIHPGDWKAAAAAAVSAAEGGGSSGSAVYLVPSLINHSCEPNLDVLWERGDFNLSLWTRRPIDPDEELTITYIDANASVDMRREQLAFGYGFTCNCERCVEEGGAIAG